MFLEMLVRAICVSRLKSRNNSGILTFFFLVESGTSGSKFASATLMVSVPRLSSCSSSSVRFCSIPDHGEDPRIFDLSVKTR